MGYLSEIRHTLREIMQRLKDRAYYRSIFEKNNLKDMHIYLTIQLVHGDLRSYEAYCFIGLHVVRKVYESVS